MKYTSFLLLAVLVFSSCNNKEAGDKVAPDSTNTSDSTNTFDSTGISNSSRSSDNIARRKSTKSNSSDMNPCSCVDRAIEIINRASSEQDMMALDKAIEREIPECNNIMESADAQGYVNDNCPDAENRMMAAAQSKVEELGLMD